VKDNNSNNKDNCVIGEVVLNDWNNVKKEVCCEKREFIFIGEENRENI
jgi:hypothetical protein